MKLLCSYVALVCLLLTSTVATSQEFSVELMEQSPQAEGVAPELAKQFAANGYRVKRDASRTVCELWLCKELEIKPDFTPAGGRLYPFEPGQLIGLVHYSRKSSDFRDQTVASGWYTLRYELQPVDGNHVGTSPTRDFLLLVKAEHDEVDKDWDLKELQSLSSEAIGASHPAMICLQEPVKEAKPFVRHNAEADWWILHVMAKGKAEGKSVDIPLDMVIEGHAAE